MSMVQQAVEVSAPLHTVYEQLAAFENYPRFMSGVRQVTSLGNNQTHWVMEVDGKRREFDAQITERSLDERVSWTTMEGPLLAETITVRPMGETKTQVVAQLEADIAFLMPSDRHGQATLTKRLKADLTTFKSLVESGALGGARPVAGRAETASGVSGGAPVAWRADVPESPSPSAAPVAGRADVPDRPSLSAAPTAGRADALGRPSPSEVAARIRNRQPHPGAGWGTSAEHGNADAGSVSAPDATNPHDVDAPEPGRRIAKAGPISGGSAGTARMGGRTAAKDMWGDGMINEEDRGSV